MNRPASADAVEGTSTSPAKTADRASRRRRIGSVGLLFGGRRARGRAGANGAGAAVPTGRGRESYGGCRTGAGRSALGAQPVEQQLEVPAPVQLRVRHR